MSRLENKLTRWEAKKLISPEQKQKIIEFENKNKKPHLQMAVFSLGIFIVSLGIISMIAANWDEISGTTKLIIDFAVLAALAGGIMVAESRNENFWKEAGVFALFMMVCASVGLIAQVFQTNGTFSNGVLVATLFTTPLLAVSQKKLLPLFWVPLFLCGICYNMNFFNFMRMIYEYLEMYFYWIPALVHLPFILVFALLAYGFYKLNLFFNRKYPIFAVLRGYSEALMYCSALISLLDNFFITERFGILNLILPIAVFATGAWIYYKHNSRTMQNFNIAMIGVCFFIAYMRLFSNLLTTGIGLVFSGLLLIVLVWASKVVMQKMSIAKGVR